MRNWSMDSRTLAIRVVAATVLITIAAALYESFNGLYIWATLHTLTGASAFIFPLTIDTFILSGESALFLSSKDGWKWKAKIVPWLSVSGGLAVSVLFNTGRVTTTDWTTHVTDGIAPAAAAAALFIGLGVLKRTKARKVTPEKVTPVAAVQTQRVTEPPPAATQPVRTASKPQAQLKVKAGTRQAKVATLMEANPTLKVNTLARTLGVSWSTANKDITEWRKNRPTGMQA